MIDGGTKLIAHIGYPTATFRAPLIYNPWFRRRGINAAVVPLGVTKLRTSAKRSLRSAVSPISTAL